MFTHNTLGAFGAKGAKVNTLVLHVLEKVLLEKAQSYFIAFKRARRSGVTLPGLKPNFGACLRTVSAT